MLTLVRRFAGVSLAATALLVVGVPGADAQVVLPNSQGIVNPYFRVAPNLSLNQAAYNTRVMGRALNSVPPWAFGYNPYPSPIYTPYAPINYPTPYYTCLGYCAAGTDYSALTTAPGGYGGGYGAAGSLYSNAYGGGYGGNMYSNPYGGYGGYGGGYYDPYGGYLTGAAYVIQAQGQFMLQQQQALMMSEQYKRSRMDTHRKLLEEWDYERKFLAALPDPRDVDAKFALHRALSNPPLTEVLTGDSLNAILANIKKLQDKNGMGVTVPLEEDMLKDINLTNGEPGNIGLLKKEGKLSWPIGLQGPAFAEERKRVDQLAQAAIEQVKFNGHVDPGTRDQLLKDAATLQEKLSENVRELTPSQGVDAKRFLSQLDDALKALQQKNVQNYFNGQWQAKGKTVADLVKNLGGLRFNSATQGDEVAYRLLIQRLTAYNMALEQQLAQK